MHEEGHVDDGTLIGHPAGPDDAELDEPTRETPVVAPPPEATAEPTQWAPPPAALPTVAAPRRPRPAWLLPALVGALVGAAVSGGIVAVAKDSGSSSTTLRPAAVGRNSSVLTRPSDIQGVLAKVEPAVVSVNTRGFEQGFFDVVPTEGAGTGMVISADGDVLTNAHVVSGATNIKVKFVDGKTYDANVVGADTSADVAVIHIAGATNLPTVELGHSADLRVGDDLVAIGNALALAGGPTVTTGIVSALDRTIDVGDEHLEHMIQTDAAINPGNSGGPLVNSRGQVVGMNTAVSNAQNIGFAIAIDTARPIADDLKHGNAGTTARAFLGVSTVTLTEDLRAELGIKASKGALVRGVQQGAPAENAGLQAGDVIIRVGDADIASSDDLGTAVRRHKAGDRIEIRWQRGSDQRSATVTLGSTTLSQ